MDSNNKMHLFFTSNVIIPIHDLIIEKGYKISKLDNGFWLAENDQYRFSGDSIEQIGSLIFLIENKGKDWKSQDDKIESFLSKYHNQQ